MGGIQFVLHYSHAIKRDPIEQAGAQCAVVRSVTLTIEQWSDMKRVKLQKINLFHDKIISFFSCSIFHVNGFSI